MVVPYIWLGKNSEVLPSGNIALAAIGTDKWTIRPLLGWNRDPLGVKPDSFTPALLIRKENPALNQLLKILGANEDEDPTLTLAIGSDWLVFRFNSLKMAPAPATVVDLAVYPTSLLAFVPHTVSPSITFLAPNVKTLVIDNLKLDDTKPLELNITPPTVDSAIFQLTFFLKQLDLKPFGDEIDLTGKKFVLEFDTTTDNLKINGLTLNNLLDGIPPQLKLGIGGIDIFIEEIDSNLNLKFGFEIGIGEGSYTYKPLISAISDSSVILEWEEFRIRLYDDRLGLAAPPGASDDAKMTATFTLPLIQAEVGEDIANALAKLMPAEVSNTTVLTPLKFKVTIKKPSDTVSLEPLLWTFERNGISLKPGKPFEEGLQTLKAIFEVFEEGLTEVTTKLNSFFAQLKELTGLVDSTLSFTVGKIENPDLIGLFKTLDAFNTTDYLLPLILRLERDGSPPLEFLLVLRLNLWGGRLNDNRAYFYIIGSDSGLLDLTAFAIQLPVRAFDQFKNLPPEFILPTEKMHDGYLDFEALDLVIDVVPKTQPNRPQTTVFVPGDFANNKNERRRVQLRLEDFDPDLWPEPSKDKTLQLRLGARGLTFAAKARTDTPAIIPVPGADDLSLRLLESRDGLQSGLVVINNQVRYANLVGRIEVPGFNALEADIQLSLRQNMLEKPLAVIAVIDLQHSDRKPLAQLKIAFLKIQLDDLRMQLTWTNSDWELKAWASGALSITEDLASTGGIDLLDQPRAIPFRDLDLTKLHQGSGGLLLNQTESPDQGLARFDLLDGLFRIEFQRATLRWDIPAESVQLDVEQARFYFQASSGELDVSIQAGRVILTLDLARGTLQFKISSSLGIEVRIGTQIKFAGEAGWQETARERYFFARGSLQMSGFPEVKGFLKLGTGIKEDGSTAPNLAIFADLPYEAELFSGVVMKRVGLGLGLNNRLAALGTRPEPREILARLDQINPEQEQNWTFVSEGGVYVSVVATTLLGSNRGNVTCAYLAKLILSIDTNIDIVAVAQIWLFSSQQFLEQGDHSRRPALVGAAVFRAREQTFSLVAQTLPRPAIESNKMLSDLLSRVQARFSFYLSPDLADYYLEELSYSLKLFGDNVDFLVIGSYRIAIGKFGALFRAQLALRGSLPKRSLNLGVGGFEFSGDMALDADFGGLVTSQGLTAYGAVRVSIAFRVSAFILIPTIALETITFEKTFSITVSIPYLSCRRWRCKWKTEDITETVTVKVTLVFPIVKIKPYHLPETTLDLLLEGALAFDESGAIGFSGTLAIFTSICGHSLRIAPRFDYRPEVVNSVRSRVAAVENRINQLRGLPRPQNSISAADSDKDQPPVETWYYYTSQNGDEIYHLLVPSPEYPTWWYTPRATGLDQYANLPRDMEVKKENGGASDIERNHLSPFRNAVMRMVLPFVRLNEDRTNGDVEQVIDLAMPWDRANYDAFPDADSELTEDERIALLIKLKEIESAFLNTAAFADKPEVEREQWEKQEIDPNRVPLNGVDVVSDPRPESGARVFWTLNDQMTRPDYALPYRYRPVEELIAEGFTGVDRRDDIGRLLRYDAIRCRAMVQARTKDFDPRPARKLAQARAGLLSTILADFVREDGAQTYAPIKDIKLEREDDGTARIVVARRRNALWVKPTGFPLKYVIHVTYAILENNTDLDLTPDSNNQVNIKWTINDSPPSEQVDLVSKLPALFDQNSSEEEVNAARHTPLTNGIDPLDLLAVQIVVSREFPIATAPSISLAPKESLLIFELLPKEFANAQMGRQVGLFAVTKADRNQKLQLDFSRVRIVRNEETSDLEPGKTLITWAGDSPVRIIPMTDPDRIEEIQRWVKCLEPCQEFLSVDDSNNQQGKFKVRVRLPVKFEEELLKSQLPRLNGFEIYRRFPWEKQSVKIADYVTPIIQRVDEGAGITLLVENFLFSEDFPYNQNTGRFEGVATGIIPGIHQIEYSLRAIPYGRLPSQDQLPPPTFRRWPAVTLYIPPVEAMMPPLGLVVPVESLFLFEKLFDEHSIPVQLVDSNHATWDWSKKGWQKLEIWAEAEGIKSTGSYALDEESVQENSPVTQRQEIQTPRDIKIERLPESVGNKILIGTLTPERSSWHINKSKFTVGRSYRLFIRPMVATDMALCQPMPIYLIRKLPERIDDTTPLCNTDRLELIGQSELDRILQPIILNGMAKSRPESWLLNDRVTISSLPSINPRLERLRITWDHLSDLDAGVEILTQDVDEPHRVGRRLVTAQAENVFQNAIRDFRNPDLWHPLPDSKQRPEDEKNQKIKALRSSTPKTDDITKLLLWDDERNPALDRVRAAHSSLQTEVTKYLSPPKEGQDEKEGQDDWVLLHQTLSEYQFALFAYQRTPLAPATPEDREGLNALAAIARALLLGLDVEPIENLKNFYDKLMAGEDDLRKALDELAKIDLSKMTVSDTPDDYERIKKELQDIDLARKFAEIIELRLEIANDLLDPDTSDDDWPSILKDSKDRLPRFLGWKSLVETYNVFTRREIIDITQENPAIVTTQSNHNLTNGERVSIANVLVGMTQINNKVSVVEVVDATKFKLLNVDSSINFTLYSGGGTIQREIMQRTQKLLTFFDKDASGLVQASGGKAAAQLSNLLMLIRDPSVLLPSNSDDLTRSPGYRQEVAKLVPQAAGLTAAIDTLKRDAQARSWTLLRRPHHQLGIELLEGEGRKAKLTPLQIYLPDNIEGAETSDSALVMPFVNLLERFGFAIDLAVVDALNQPLQQARLVDWIDSQNWKSIRSSIDRKITHEIVLITGREPDTDRDQPDTLGYAFIKLAVVPHNILADLLGRKIDVNITVFDALTKTLTIDKSKDEFTKNGWIEETQISLKLTDGTEIPPFALSTMIGNQIPFSGTLTTALPVPATATENAAADQSSFRQWLVQRALLAPDPNIPKPTPTPEPTPNELTELGIVKRMVELWLREIYPLKGKNDSPVGHVIVETRGRRWATVPVLGGRAHLDWEAFDSAGHEVNIAVRRVSRYEALLRWARGRAVPTLTRIYGLEPTYYQTIDFCRRIQVGVEEPTALPVLVSPHPTKIDFIYALPTSGARATISGLSARRNGYQGLIARFIQKRLQVVTGLSDDAHQTILDSGIQKDSRLIKLTVTTVTTVTGVNTWEVIPVPGLANFDSAVVFSQNREQVRLCSSYTETTTTPIVGTLTFRSDETDFPVEFPNAASGLPHQVELSALIHPISDPVLTHMSLKGSITRIGTTNDFRLALDETSDRLDDDPRTYISQLLIVLNGTVPIHARLIDDFRASDQTLIFNNDPLPSLLTQAPIRILFRAKLPLRDRIDHSEAGTPMLYRNERLISLPALPYYRKYSVQLQPHFNATEISPLEDRTKLIPPEDVYGQRKASVIATHPAHLVVTSPPLGEIIYEFRLVLSRQGDLLSPAELKTEANLTTNPDKEGNRLSSVSIPDFQPLPADLPDLLCHYQVVWPLPELSSTTLVNNAAYLDLFDVILPGHPLWTLPSPLTNYVLVRNRSGTNNAKLQESGADSDNNLYLPISLWCPTSNAQPTYIVNVSIKILEPGIALFGNPDLALLQVQRDGRRSSPIPISQLKL